MNETTLGERMKGHEKVFRTVLPRRNYTILRLDGRAFHTYCRGLEKPYDLGFMSDMDTVAEAVCKEVSGAALAYTQSDEISVLLTDLQGTNTQPWFDGQVQKIISVAASIATAHMNILRHQRTGRIAQFDARVFTLPNAPEVANYFLWRQRDAVRNSISMSAQAEFSHRELQGLSAGELQEKLYSERGINWNNHPAGFKRGRVQVREVFKEEVEFFHKKRQELQKVMTTRSRWTSQEAPHFTLEPGGFLAGIIPTQPQLG